MSHVIHDGWNVKFRENQELQITNIEPYLDSIRNFLNRHADAEIVSISFWAKRMAFAGSFDYQGKATILEQNFTANEIASLPDNWLARIRNEIVELDKKQMAEFLPA